MPLQTSGPISIGNIRTELEQSSGSLTFLSESVGFGNPHLMSEFYGYSNTTSVTITAIVPFEASCYSYVDFYLNASHAVTTDVTGYISWNGDLGGYFQGTVTLYNGQAFTNSSIYTGGGVNCIGETFSSGDLYLSVGTGPGQIYLNMGVSTSGF